MKEKKFNIAVVGGGLTGSILIHFLISNQILKNITCCWIKPNNERKENRVSFYNQNNYEILKHYGVFKNINDKEINKILKIKIWNRNIKKPLELSDKDGIGIICKNSTVINSLNQKSNNLKIFNQKVIMTSHDDYKRKITLENGESIYTDIVLAADGKNSILRELCDIRTIRKKFNHIAVSGYLQSKNISIETAKQIFINEGPVGLLPISKPVNYINFVWSVNNNLLNKFTSDDELVSYLIEKLNNFFEFEKIEFSKPIGQVKSDLKDIFKQPLELIYVPVPISNRIALIGDSSHNIHPLAGQGFNLSIEDCFEIIKILKANILSGNDLGNIENLNRYYKSRKKRTRSISILTSSIFLTFTSRSNLLQNFIALGMEKINKTKLKNIFRRFATGL